MQSLQGLRVIELASVLAGPSVGQFFAEAGAEVIKVENPHTFGDVTRTWLGKGEKLKAGVSAFFSAVNWGKKSITLDLNRIQGREVLYQLIERSDMVIASYKPGDDTKLGVDFQTLQRIKPNLIYGHITGYGPDQDRVGYDAIVQAEAGFMHLNRLPGELPQKMPVALIDILAGHHLKEGMLLAYIQLLKTGKGAYVPVSLMDAALASLANQASLLLHAGLQPQPMGSDHPSIAPYGSLFTSKDQRHLMLAVGNDKQFHALCQILDIGELSASPLFSTNPQRVANREELKERLQLAIQAFNADELLHQLHQQKIPAAIILNVSEALERYSSHMTLEANGLKGLATFVANGNKSSFSSHFLPPPALGAHNQDVYGDFLGFDEEKIEFLRQQGLI